MREFADSDCRALREEEFAPPTFVGKSLRGCEEELRCGRKFCVTFVGGGRLRAVAEERLALHAFLRPVAGSRHCAALGSQIMREEYSLEKPTDVAGQNS